MEDRFSVYKLGGYKLAIDCGFTLDQMYNYDTDIRIRKDGEYYVFEIYCQIDGIIKHTIKRESYGAFMDDIIKYILSWNINP